MTTLYNITRVDQYRRANNQWEEESSVEVMSNLHKAMSECDKLNEIYGIDTSQHKLYYCVVPKEV